MSKKKKNVIYLTGHPGFVNYSIAHRLTVNKDANATLIYGKIGDLTNNIQSMVDFGIFDNAIYAFDTMGQLQETEESVKDKIKEYYDRIFKQNNISLKNIDEFYIGVDTLNSYGIYLIMNNVPFFYFEGGFRNLFNISKQRVCDIYPHIASDAYKATMHDCGISDASNPLITKIVNPESKYQTGKSIIFDISEAVKKIDSDVAEKLLQIYEVKRDEIPSGSIEVVAMSSQWGIRNHSEEKQTQMMIEMYQLIIDYFASGTNPVVVKPHPFCKVSETVFKENYGLPVLPKVYPMEFMPLMPDVNITKMLSVESNSCYGDNCVRLGFSYYTNYEFLEIIDYILSFHHKYCKDSSVIACGISEEFLSNVSIYRYGKPLVLKGIQKSEENITAVINYKKDPDSLGKIIKKLHEYRSYAIFVINFDRVKDVLKSLAEQSENSISATLSKTFKDGKQKVQECVVLSNVNDIANYKYNFNQNIGKCSINISTESIRTTYPRELAQLFRDAPGDKRDLDKAILYMSYSALLNQKWSKKELMRLLWMRRSPKDIRLLYECATKLSTLGDYEAFGFLARMYSNGLLVPKDKDKAKKLYSKAAEGNIKWASKELEELISDNHTDSESDL
jgi:hypothetical protein